MKTNKGIKTQRGLFLVTALVLMAFVAPPDDDESAAQAKVERSVLQWADETFEFYDGVRFENFKEVPTQELFALDAKIETLKEFKVELQDAFDKGELKKTQEDLNKQFKKIDHQVDSLGKLKAKVDPESKDYEIHFWANIMVSNAVTVYYQHLVKLNGRFEITGVSISGAVGTQPDGVKILYKKTAKIKAKNRKEARN